DGRVGGGRRSGRIAPGGPSRPDGRLGARRNTLMSHRVIVPLLVASLVLPRSAAAQTVHSLDDWMTVSRVASFVWAPDGRSIYFTSNAAPSGTYEIFRTPLDGGTPVQVSRGSLGRRAEPKTDLAVSADGSTLVFTAASLRSEERRVGKECRTRRGP